MGVTPLFLLQALGIIGMISGILCLVLTIDMLRTANKLGSKESQH